MEDLKTRKLKREKIEKIINKNRGGQDIPILDSSTPITPHELKKKERRWDERP
jgi:hypothetical protein